MSTNEQTTTTITRADLMGKTTPDLLALCGADPSLIPLITAVMAEREKAPVCRITIGDGSNGSAGYVILHDASGPGSLKITLPRAKMLAAPDMPKRLAAYIRQAEGLWPTARLDAFWDGWNGITPTTPKGDKADRTIKTTIRQARADAAVKAYDERHKTTTIPEPATKTTGPTAEV